MTTEGTATTVADLIHDTHSYVNQCDHFNINIL